MRKLYWSFFLLMLFLASCGGSSTTEQQNNQNTTDPNAQTTADAGEGQPALSEDVINEIIQSIPSPLEVSYLIKSLGTEYKKENLNNPDLVDNYTNNYKKALNLGVYSTDLGFANIYSKNQDALNYLNSVKKLADGLNIGQFFDYNTIKKLVNNNENLDSLLQMTTSNFEKINYHLRQQKREYLSILILTGGWVEAGHLTSMVYKETNNKSLKEKIGEQKLVLDRILLVLDVYKTKPNFNTLIDDLKELKKVYDRVEIIVEESPPQMKVEDGQIVIETKNKSTVKISDADVEAISSLFRSIRNKIVK